MLDVKDRVLKTLDDRKNETAELLRELIRTPSVTGEEKQVAELIAKKLKESGLENVEIDGAGQDNMLEELIELIESLVSNLRYSLSQIYSSWFQVAPWLIPLIVKNSHTGV